MFHVFRNLAAALCIATTAQAADLGDDGLYDQPWMSDSFLELADDIAEAEDAGKDLMVIFEQKGCPYCREMHLVNFARQDISDYVRENFVVVQLNLWGAREVVDVDGSALEERELAVKWGVNFTPTTLIFAGDTPADQSSAEAFRMPGYFKPFHHMKSLEFIASDAYKTQVFQRIYRGSLKRWRKKALPRTSGKAAFLARCLRNSHLRICW